MTSNCGLCGESLPARYPWQHRGLPVHFECLHERLFELRRERARAREDSQRMEKPRAERRDYQFRPYRR